MLATGWRITPPPRGMGVAGIAAVAFGLLAGSASAMTVTAHTSRGGTCHLRTSAARSGDTIDYRIKVKGCSTRFGVRYVVSRGVLYDQTNRVPVANGYMKRKRGGLRYSNHRSVGATDPTHPYRTRIDVSIVLKTRRDRSTPHPEKWLDPGKRCRVKTTERNGDTLGCELGDSLRA